MNVSFIDSMIGRSGFPNQCAKASRQNVVLRNPTQRRGPSCIRTLWSVGSNHGANFIRSVSNASEQRTDAVDLSNTPDPDSQQDWSPLLKNSTAILPGSTDGATAYILGVSHVSKESCGLIEELIEKVKPDAVMLELCHERTGLLIDEKAASKGQNAWFSDVVDVIGLDENFEFKEQLLKRLKTYQGCPVSTQGIQSDADILLATGLFESVTPITAPPAESGWDPMFVYVENMKRLIPGVQLGAIQFKVVPRTLPQVDRIAEITFEDAIRDVDIDAIQDLIEETMMDGGENTMDTLIRVKKQLYDLTRGRCDIRYQFDRASDGSMHANARIVASKGGLFENITSFEETVQNDGTGIGIQRRANAPQFMGFQAANQSSSALAAITPWDAESANIKKDKISVETNAGFLESLANMLTMTYGKYQADAGRQVGILPGEAWRVAFETAAKTKTPYIFLGDRRASITAERLLKAIIASSLPLFLASIVISTASWFTPPLLLNMRSSLPGTFATALVSMAAASWPLISPILEIKAFSEMSPKDIENAVRVNEPLQSNNETAPFYLWGEDALIRWPGAEEPVIRERDEYMTRAITGFLNNNSSDLTPTYVATSEESYGATIYSYAMPKNASNIVCPPGKGQGQFELGTRKPRTVVAIVGTAHVRGIINHFKSGCITRTLEDLSM